MDSPKEPTRSASIPLSWLERRRKSALTRRAAEQQRGVAKPPAHPEIEDFEARRAKTDERGIAQPLATSAGDAKVTPGENPQPRRWRGPLPLMSASRPVGLATPFSLWEFEKIMFYQRVQPDFDGSEKQVRWALRIFWNRHPGICRYAYQQGADASIELRFNDYLAVMNLRYERDATFWIDVETHNVPNKEVVESVRRVGSPPWRR